MRQNQNAELLTLSLSSQAMGPQTGIKVGLCPANPGNPSPTTSDSPPHLQESCTVGCLEVAGSGGHRESVPCQDSSISLFPEPASSNDPKVPCCLGPFPFWN